MPYLFLLGAVVVGMLVAIQPPINAHLGRALGHPMFGSMANFAVGVMVAVGITLLLRLVGIIKINPPSADALASAPWWAWLGGVLGATFVTASILLIPQLGALAFVGAMLTGQLICASVLDHFGLVGLDKQAVTPTRIIGIALLVAGVLTVQAGAHTAGKSNDPASQTQVSEGDTP